KGQLAGARVVRDGYQVMLISDGGTVIRMPVDDIKRSGRATQGVIVMRLREGEHVSSLAPVVETAADDKVEAAVDSNGAGPANAYPRHKPAKRASSKERESGGRPSPSGTRAVYL